MKSQIQKKKKKKKWWNCGITNTITLNKIIRNQSTYFVAITNIRLKIISVHGVSL